VPALPVHAGSSLLAGNEKINVPFAGPVSVFGFMLLPAVLIILRAYLQIYVEHERRLDRRTANPAETHLGSR
jgi:hypothetical protein